MRRVTHGGGSIQQGLTDRSLIMCRRGLAARHACRNCSSVSSIPSSKVPHRLLRASVSEVSGRQRLPSASRRKLNIPRFRRSTCGTRAFSDAAPARRSGTNRAI